MTYLLIFDLEENGRGRRRVDRYLGRTARRVQRSVWEFRCLPDLIEAAELVRKGGGRALGFSRKDELLLHISKVKEVLEQAARSRTPIGNPKGPAPARARWGSGKIGRVRLR